MASNAYGNAWRRIHLAIAGAAAATVLAATSAGAMPLPEAPSARPATSSVSAAASAGVRDRGRPDARPRLANPGYLLDRGRFIPFDVPDATVATSPGGINNLGQIVGAYSRTTGRVGDDPNRRAFVLDRGKVTTIDGPAGTIYTQAFGMNNRLQVVGEFVDGSSNGHGFLWDKGRFTSIDVPGSDYSIAWGINDFGQVVGAHVVDLTAQPLKLSGFVLDRGRYTSFDVPDAGVTSLSDINNLRQIVGSSASDLTTILTGSRPFLLPKGINGRLVPFRVPGVDQARVAGLNDLGQFTGNYRNPNPT